MKNLLSQILTFLTGLFARKQETAISVSTMQSDIFELALQAKNSQRIHRESYKNGMQAEMIYQSLLCESRYASVALLKNGRMIAANGHYYC